MRSIKAVFMSLVFVMTLLVTYYTHATYFHVNVVFYSALADALIATLLVSVILFLLTWCASFNTMEKSLLVVIWLLSGYVFAISVPTIIDRSLSFYILEKIQQRGGGIKQSEIQRVFTDEYVREHRLVDVRLTEQLESGTIRIKNGCVELTKKGRKIASFGRYFRQHFLPKKRLLMGEYSDDLTDPFRRSAPNLSYTCKVKNGYE